jgi:hypothetical protein
MNPAPDLSQTLSQECPWELPDPGRRGRRQYALLVWIHVRARAENLQDLSEEELDLLKETTDSLILYVEEIKEKRPD